MTSGADSTLVRIAYLINQSPKTSHGFVWREIGALTKLGVRVDRYAIRAVQDPLVEPADREEATATPVTLDEMGRTGTNLVAEHHLAGLEAVKLARLFQSGCTW